MPGNSKTLWKAVNIAKNINPNPSPRHLPHTLKVKSIELWRNVASVTMFTMAETKLMYQS